MEENMHGKKRKATLSVEKVGKKGSTSNSKKKTSQEDKYSQMTVQRSATLRSNNASEICMVPSPSKTPKRKRMLAVTDNQSSPLNDVPSCSDEISPSAEQQKKRPMRRKSFTGSYDEREKNLTTALRGAGETVPPLKTDDDTIDGLTKDNEHSILLEHDDRETKILENDFSSDGNKTIPKILEIQELSQSPVEDSSSSDLKKTPKKRGRPKKNATPDVYPIGGSPTYSHNIDKSSESKAKTPKKVKGNKTPLESPCVKSKVKMNTPSKIDGDALERSAIPQSHKMLQSPVINIVDETPKHCEKNLALNCTNNEQYIEGQLQSPKCKSAAPQMTGNSKDLQSPLTSPSIRTPNKRNRSRQTKNTPAKEKRIATTTQIPHLSSAKLTEHYRESDILSPLKKIKMIAIEDSTKSSWDSSMDQDYEGKTITELRSASEKEKLKNLATPSTSQESKTYEGSDSSFISSDEDSIVSCEVSTGKYSAFDRVHQGGPNIKIPYGLNVYDGNNVEMSLKNQIQMPRADFIQPQEHPLQTQCHDKQFEGYQMQTQSHVIQSEQTAPLLNPENLKTNKKVMNNRDEDSLLAAEWLTRLPHARMDKDYRSSSGIAEFQPLATDNSYHKQMTPLLSEAERNQPANNIQHSSSTQMLGKANNGQMSAPQEQNNVSLPTQNTMMQNSLSNFQSVPRFIPSSNSAFSAVPAQQSTPATSHTASEILYQNSQQNNYWNQGDVRQSNFPGNTDLPLKTTTASRHSDPGIWSNVQQSQQTQPLQYLNPTVNSHSWHAPGCPPTSPRQQFTQQSPDNIASLTNSGHTQQDMSYHGSGMFEQDLDRSHSGYMISPEMHSHHHQFNKSNGSIPYTVGQPGGAVDQSIDDFGGLQSLNSNFDSLRNCGGLSSPEINDCNLPLMDSVNDSVIMHSEGPRLGSMVRSPKNVNYLRSGTQSTKRAPNKKRRSKQMRQFNCSNMQPPAMADVYSKHTRTQEDITAVQSLGVEREGFFLILSPEVNQAEVKDIGHRGLVAKYIDYLIMENEQITEMSKSVCVPIEHCVMDDPYLMDIIRVKVPFPTPKYYHWLHSYYPSIHIDWKALHQQMLHYSHPLSDCQHVIVDKRPTPVLLGESFYFFQREKDRLVSC